MIEAIFWLSAAFVFYAYAGYPLLLAAFSFFRNRPVQKGSFAPKVSFIIAAYNEEKRIEDKLINTLNQVYPKERMEILVASDCSSDKTDGIVLSYRPKGVQLVRAPERRGKENAQRYAVEKASGEILIFSDVATILDPNGVAAIVRNFSDAEVGCVSSVDRFIDPDGKLTGEGAYVKYEMLLRRLESRINSVVGLSGSFFAARSAVCRDWAVDLQSDFNTLLNSIRMGLRGVADPESVGYYKNLADEGKEFERKVRTVVRGISVFMKSLFLLNPFRYGLFSWQLFSHKLCRWLVPFAMILGFISNGLLVSRSAFYFYALWLQVAFYAVAFGGMAAGLSSKKYYLKIPSFLVLVNLSILKAWYRYMRGERFMAWEPSKR
ncbi:MAG TPA: glycosyltransferase family 2 protein [Nitrospiria bacterium]|nr:glycosyltransferase family 2 protein [Nitrospiria bacterium]HUK55084.1 glycosyltransferase family 2 protein [Nitrospiria bacterium]